MYVYQPATGVILYGSVSTTDGYLCLKSDPMAYGLPISSFTNSATGLTKTDPVYVVGALRQSHSQANPTWTDIIGTPANIAATFPNGVEGQWIPVIPDSVIDDFPMNRKWVSDPAVNTTYTQDNGTTWSSTNGGINSTTNIYNFGNHNAVQVSLINYETQAHFTQDDVNSEVLDLGGVLATNFHNILYSGNISSSLIGKVSINSTNGRLLESNVDKFAIDPTVGMLFSGGTGAYGEVEHLSINLGASSPAVKTLDYLSRENGRAKLMYAYKEMDYDVDWGDNSGFIPADNQSTLTDDNGNTVLYGTASFDLPYFIGDDE